MVFMTTELSTGRLPSLGVLRIAGRDARSFLQGQLSNDMQRLSRESLLAAGMHNPQGRVIALLRLTLAADDEVLALLPASLTDAVAQRLRRFVLRAQVRISDESALWQVHGCIGGASAETLRWPAATPRGCRLVPAATIAATADDGDFPRHWQAAEIADGVPRVDAFNSEQHVSQMLNLDLVDAVSFDKGCYTGQEIIARAHYRGRVKRRMQRFISESAANVQVGDSLTLQDGRDATVIDALPHADGRSEFLALTTWPLPADLPTSSTGLHCMPLPLPYDLPD